MKPMTHHPSSSRISTAINHPNDLIVNLANIALNFQIPASLAAFTALQPNLETEFSSYRQACYDANHLLLSLNRLDTIARICQQSKIGKKLPTALYVHISAVADLNPLLRVAEHWGRRFLPPYYNTTLVKFHTNQLLISYLSYPDFDRDPHPTLKSSLQVNLPQGTIRKNEYSLSDNPPILHRKETFVRPDYPDYQKFIQLTRMEEHFGLLDQKINSLVEQDVAADTERIYRTIGTYKGWQQHLAQHGVSIEDYQVVSGLSAEAGVPLTPKIERHKAAMVRKNLSRPVRLALEAELFQNNETFFDYGCGYGGDIQRLNKKGIISAGWDPYYAPENPKIKADIVNLGYIINVIEDQAERREALIQAWELTEKVLIVAAQILIADRTQGLMVYSDGVITRRNTFQKYYEQEELKTYINQVLGVNAIPIDLGIYFVFRDHAQAEQFRAERCRSQVRSPRIRTLVKRFEDYETLLQPLMEFVGDRGRLPVKQELDNEREILEVFRTIPKAFKVILQVTDPQEWDEIAQKRRQDLLVYLALSQFGDRPRFSQLQQTLRNDIKGLFGSYKAACLLADQMLFSIGDPEKITQCCQESPVGQKRSGSLWVHVSALAYLNPLLRLYEGCANRTIGRQTATLVQFHMKKPKITYLFYPDFDREPHPILSSRMDINLQDLHVTYQAYEGPNSPILHRKELCVMPDYPQYDKFAKLSHQEQDWGLLENWKKIQTRQGWLQCLADHCAEIKGHRVCWRRDADPYQVKLLKSARRARRQ